MTIDLKNYNYTTINRVGKVRKESLIILKYKSFYNLLLSSKHESKKEKKI